MAPSWVRACAARIEQSPDLEHRRSRRSWTEAATTWTGPRDEKAVRDIADAVERWRESRLASDYERVPPRREEFTTLSGLPIEDVYTPADVDGPRLRARHRASRASTRTRAAPHASMYRGRPWTIRQVAGFGQAEDTNGRYKYLLAHGETGLSTDFDLPTLLGYDSDHAVYRPRDRQDRRRGRHGRRHARAVRRHPARRRLDLADDQRPGGRAARDVPGRRRRARDRRDALTGTTQNDILKEYTAQNEFIFPPVPSVELVVDTMEYGARGRCRGSTR